MHKRKFYQLAFFLTVSSFIWMSIFSMERKHFKITSNRRNTNRITKPRLKKQRLTKSPITLEQAKDHEENDPLTKEAEQLKQRVKLLEQHVENLHINPQFHN